MSVDLEVLQGLTPVGYARKQDLLVYSPSWMCYAAKPAPENGHEAVALYTQDQLEALREEDRPVQSPPTQGA